jgi:HD superfamily phosphodiesterase
MTKDQKQKAILEAQSIVDSIGDPAHSNTHNESVLAYAKEITKEYNRVDWDLLELAVWWHDVGRKYADEEHPIYSERMAREYFTKNNFTQEFTDKICKAILSHSNGMPVKPDFLEAKILKDADKLDFLTPVRWQESIKYKLDWAFEVGIKKIPLIRNHVLSLDISKKIFDRLFKEIIEYVKGVNNSYFEKYKNQVLDIKIED